jgi:quercetin dioxygenase-like cupin family protein
MRIAMSATLRNRTLSALAALFAVVCLMSAQYAGAQGDAPSGFSSNKVIPLLRADLTGIPNRQVIANIYEVPAGAMVPRHFHHGDEFHFVLAGEWAAEVEGRSTHIMKAGDSQYVPRELWHGGRVVSSGPMRLLGIMIVEKDKPIIEIKK